MTDQEERDDEQRCRTATALEREYASGWRAYVLGLPRSYGAMWEQGYRDAKYAHETDRDVLWSVVPAEGHV